MMLETETDGVLENPTEDDVRHVFKSDTIVGNFIRLSRTYDNFLHIELRVFDEEESPDWVEGILGVYKYDPDFGRFELEDWSVDGYQSGRFGGSCRQQLREMFLHYLRGPESFTHWAKSWTGKFRGDC